MVALVVALLIFALVGGFGFAAHILWLVGFSALVLRALAPGCLVGGVRAELL